MKKWLYKPSSGQGKVYVIGVMNAGKSTFINMLLNYIKNPGLESALTQDFTLLDVDPGECTYLETTLLLEKNETQKIILDGNYRKYSEFRNEYRNYSLSKGDEIIVDFDTFREKIKENTNGVLETKSDVELGRIAKNCDRYPRENDLRIVSEITSLEISIKHPNIPFQNQIQLIDTPGFDTAHYQVQNDRTIKNIKDASKLLIVCGYDQIEAESLKTLIENVTEVINDIPIYLIINVRSVDLEAGDIESVTNRIDTIHSLLKGYFREIQFRVYVMNFQFIFTSQKTVLSSLKKFPKEIHCIDNGCFNDALFKELMSIPEMNISEKLRGILEYNQIEHIQWPELNTIRINVIEDDYEKLFRWVRLNKSILDNKSTASPKHKILVHISKEISELVCEKILIEDEKGLDMLAGYKQLIERTKNIPELDLQEDINILNEFIEESLWKLVNRFKVQKDKHLSYFIEDLEFDSDLESCDSISKETETKIKSGLQHFFETYNKLQYEYINAVDRLYFQYKFNVRMKEQIN